jgi:hypothetical protein
LPSGSTPQSRPELPTGREQQDVFWLVDATFDELKAQTGHFEAEDKFGEMAPPAGTEGEAGITLKPALSLGSMMAKGEKDEERGSVSSEEASSRFQRPKDPSQIGKTHGGSDWAGPRRTHATDGPRPGDYIAHGFLENAPGRKVYDYKGPPR